MWYIRFKSSQNWNVYKQHGYFEFQLIIDWILHSIPKIQFEVNSHKTRITFICHVMQSIHRIPLKIRTNQWNVCQFASNKIQRNSPISSKVLLFVKKQCITMAFQLFLFYRWKLKLCQQTQTQFHSTFRDERLVCVTSHVAIIKALLKDIYVFSSVSVSRWDTMLWFHLVLHARIAISDPKM